MGEAPEMETVGGCVICGKPSFSYTTADVCMDHGRKHIYALAADAGRAFAAGAASRQGEIDRLRAALRKIGQWVDGDIDALGRDVMCGHDPIDLGNAIRESCHKVVGLVDAALAAPADEGAGT